jgi:hypothetical protein
VSVFWGVLVSILFVLVNEFVEIQYLQTNLQTIAFKPRDHVLYHRVEHVYTERSAHRMYLCVLYGSD